jgi:predicted DNA-binding protein (MmcQ/YjbR family)
MDKQSLITYCSSKPVVSSDFPFDDEVMVFRICGKIFALINIKLADNSISLKCNPELAVLLREEYKGITPGYHLNKKHWNTVDCNSEISDEKIKELIDHSYTVTTKGLTKKQRVEIGVEKDKK